MCGPKTGGFLRTKIGGRTWSDPRFVTPHLRFSDLQQSVALVHLLAPKARKRGRARRHGHSRTGQAKTRGGRSLEREAERATDMNGYRSECRHSPGQHHDITRLYSWRCCFLHMRSNCPALYPARSNDLENIHDCLHPAARQLNGPRF